MKKKKKMIRAEIISVADSDAYLDIAHLLIGVKGWVENKEWNDIGHYSGIFVPYCATKKLKKEVSTGRLYFYKCKLRKLS